MPQKLIFYELFWKGNRKIYFGIYVIFLAFLLCAFGRLSGAEFKGLTEIITGMVILGNGAEYYFNKKKPVKSEG